MARKPKPPGQLPHRSTDQEEQIDVFNCLYGAWKHETTLTQADVLMLLTKKDEQFQAGGALNQAAWLKPQREMLEHTQETLRHLTRWTPKMLQRPEEIDRFRKDLQHWVAPSSNMNWAQIQVMIKRDETRREELMRHTLTMYEQAQVADLSPDSEHNLKKLIPSLKRFGKQDLVDIVNLSVAFQHQLAIMDNHTYDNRFSVNEKKLEDLEEMGPDKFWRKHAVKKHAMKEARKRAIRLANPDMGPRRRKPLRREGPERPPKDGKPQEDPDLSMSSPPTGANLSGEV